MSEMHCLSFVFFRCSVHPTIKMSLFQSTCNLTINYFYFYMPDTVENYSDVVHLAYQQGCAGPQVRELTALDVDIPFLIAKP